MGVGMEYKSILGERGRAVDEQVLYDLRISELLEDILGRERDEFLRSLYLEPLNNEEIAVFRLNVFRDLMRNEVYNAVENFVEKIRESIDYIELEKEAYEQHKLGLHLDAALSYIEAIESFYNDLKVLGIRSQGLLNFLNYLQSIVESRSFRLMKERVYEAKKARDGIKIRVKIIGNRIKVRRYDEGEDLSAIIKNLFSRFKEGEVEEVKHISVTSEMSHIHAAILEGAFKFYRKEYEILKRFMEDFQKIVDDGVMRFAKEVKFYLTYVRYMKKVMQPEYLFTIPNFTCDGSINVKNFYNLLLLRSGRVVHNDISTDGVKRVFVITGMNSGGKTTFAISFGQLAYLSTLGLPVPATEASLPFFTSIMTAFPAREDPRESMSRLEQDITKALKILKQANSTTLVIANELFSTTTSEEGFQLARLFLSELNRKRAYCLFVTFIPGVASIDFTISLVAMPSPEDPMKPSYKILPGSPPSEYMAVRIAAKHRLLYNHLREMLR